MLDTMLYRQYLEWLAFFKIRNEDKPGVGGTMATNGSRPRNGYGTTPEGQKQLSAAILQSMQSYQRRQDARKR